MGQKGVGQGGVFVHQQNLISNEICFYFEMQMCSLFLPMNADIIFILPMNVDIIFILPMNVDYFPLM